MANRRVGCMAWSIAGLAFMVAPCLATAACVGADWSREVGRPEHGAIYVGSLGNRPIRMMLHLDVATGRFDGVYGYSDQLGQLSLTGVARPAGTGAELGERNEQGQITGHFSLDFVRPRQPWESTAFYEEHKRKFPSTCDSPLGTWRPPQGDKALTVVLHRNGEFDLAHDGEEKLDDLAAFKLRKAMLENNRPAFALLLQYPFHSIADRRSKVWNTPEEVIEHYQEIVRFQPSEIRSAVPHALGAGRTGADFMNGSIYLSQGKITMICDERCPIVADYGNPVPF